MAIYRRVAALHDTTVDRTPRRHKPGAGFAAGHLDLARTTARLRPVLRVEDRILDRRERVSVPCSKLGGGDAEALARPGKLEAIPVEKTNHFTVPGTLEPFERRGKACRIERAPNP
jgi:hypothetical protein